ncbi:MAG: DNA gyrase subunit A [Bdellovibrionota bacterium]
MDQEVNVNRVTPVNIESEMKQSYMDYAMSVIVGRALPEARDGLKPVHRRVLYAMYKEGYFYNRKTVKCAGVVGEVLKTLHPHGDSSVYDALVRLAQSWSLRYPLIDGQGNFGSIDGDPAAAYRYTECRMMKIADYLLQDIDKNTVPLVPNFDGTSVEPLVLPTRIPNLLANGADGIAVGMATHIPPHNIGELVDGAIALIKKPNMKTLELMEYIKGPDFPTGGLIYGKKGIINVYKTGRGIIQMRAKIKTEIIKTKTREVTALVATEIPYQVNKARLVEKIAELISNKTIDGISKLRDESDRSGLRIVMELKKDATKEVVLSQLYKLTPLQSSYGVINLAIVSGRPKVCSLNKLLTSFIDHRRDVVTRRTEFELGKAKERMHILEGFKMALINLDDVIALIRKAETPSDAKKGLIEKYELSSVQAQAILDLRLQKLTSMERLAIEKEHDELKAEMERLLALLSDNAKIDALIITELEEVKEVFADPRRSILVDEVEDIDIEDLIEDENVVITVSQQGYVKRMSASLYKQQKRGGKGIIGASDKEDDVITTMFSASARQDLLVFTSLGRVYAMKAYEIPEASRTARGRALVNLLSLMENETVKAVLPVKEFREDRYLVMATKSGIVKKMDLMSLSKIRKSGIIACTLKDGDELIEVKVVHDNDDILLTTSKGMAIKFPESDLRSIGRTSMGVKGINLSKGDFVVGMVVISTDDSVLDDGDDEEVLDRVSKDDTLLTVCENGYGKRTKFEEYRAQSRAGKGLIDIQTCERNGDVVGSMAVKEEHDFILITSSGKMIRSSVSDISIIGRNTKGVCLMNLEDGEKVLACTRLPEADDENNGENNGEDNYKDNDEENNIENSNSDFEDFQDISEGNDNNNNDDDNNDDENNDDSNNNDNNKI